MLVLQKILAIENIIKSFFGQDYIIAIKNHFHKGYEFPHKNQFVFSKNKAKFLESKELIEIRFLCGLNLIAKTHNIPFFLNESFLHNHSPVFLIIPYYYDSIPLNEEYCLSYGCEFEVTLCVVQSEKKIKVYFNEYIPFYAAHDLKKTVEDELCKLDFTDHLLESLKNKNKSSLHLPKEVILNAIENVISHMQRGDAYLVNMTHTQQIINVGEKLFDSTIFMQKWFLSQPTFGLYANTDELGIMCFSPERFLIKRGSMIATQPIKGTQQIGQPELWENEKEMYEHTMVVDLLRNDLNSICEAGTVHVQNPFHIKCALKTLYMESTILGQTGKFKPDLLLNLLPAGSISGTPKKKTCELIAKYETNSRGYYTGISGIIEKKSAIRDTSFDRNFDLAVLIRSVFRGRDHIYTGVGAGITTLSNPLSEFEEFELKLQSFL
jgi:para-aminobenzoate synthetase component 1